MAVTVGDEHGLNTLDKGYSVIITLPEKMSLVSSLLLVSGTSTHVTTGERGIA